MPVPKRRLSKTRRNNRRSHDHLKTTNLTECPNCHKMKLPHTVCAECGFYKGRQIIRSSKG